MLRIDHVVYAVRDLDEAGERFHAAYGLVSVPGGVHPRWGTGNRLIPFGSDYLELIAVIDPGAARTTALGRTLLELTEAGDRWFAVCLADDDIELTGMRLGLRVDAGSRTRPDGRVISWRGAGIEDPQRTPDLPFFISWDVPPQLHPGADPPAHPSGAYAISRVDVAGDRSALDAWTDGASLPIRVVDGSPAGLRAVVLATPSGESVIR